MKKIVLLITSFFMLIFSIGSMGMTAFSSENPKPKVEFCQMNFKVAENYCYYGIFIDSDSNIKYFNIKNKQYWSTFEQVISDDWVAIDKEITFSPDLPNKKLVDYLNNNINKFKTVGKLGETEYNNYKDDLYPLSTDNKLIFNNSDPFKKFPDWETVEFSENFAVKYDSSNGINIAFLSGGIGSQDNLYLKNLDKEAINLSSMLYDLKSKEVDKRVNTDVTSTTTTTTTTAPMPAIPANIGDLNGDNKVTSEDATFTLIEYAKALLDGKKSADNLLELGDINKDGNVTSEDATCILIWYANYMLDKKTPTIDKFKF